MVRGGIWVWRGDRGKVHMYICEWGGELWGRCMSGEGRYIGVEGR